METYGSLKNQSTDLATDGRNNSMSYANECEPLAFVDKIFRSSKFKFCMIYQAILYNR